MNTFLIENNPIYEDQNNKLFYGGNDDHRWKLIFPFCNFYSLWRLSLVCKKWNSFIRINIFKITPFRGIGNRFGIYEMFVSQNSRYLVFDDICDLIKTSSFTLEFYNINLSKNNTLYDKGYTSIVHNPKILCINKEEMKFDFDSQRGNITYTLSYDNIHTYKLKMEGEKPFSPFSTSNCKICRTVYHHMVDIKIYTSYNKIKDKFISLVIPCTSKENKYINYINVRNCCFMYGGSILKEHLRIGYHK